MSIDWITVAAQIVNFAVLIWLLRRFLYRPILNGIDAREAEIAARLVDARNASDAAVAAKQDYDASLARLEADKAEILAVARADAKSEIDAKRAEFEKAQGLDRAAWRVQLDKDREEYSADLSAAGTGAILSLIRKVLSDLADAELEDLIVRNFANELRAAGPELAAKAGSADSGTVHTSHPLSPSQKKRIEQQFHASVAKVPLAFKVDETRSPGISLRFGGARLAWTIESYLDAFEANLAHELHAQKSAAS